MSSSIHAVMTTPPLGVPTYEEESKKTSATTRRYNTTIPYFKIWCKETGQDYDACLLALVDDEGRLHIDCVRRFLLWLGEVGAKQTVLTDANGKQRTVSFETFDQATKWVKMHADAQLEAKGVSRLAKGYVMKLPGMHAVKTKLTATQRRIKYMECTEADQRSDLLLTFDQMRCMSTRVLAADRVRERKERDMNFFGKKE